MKTPRELLLGRHRSIEPKLDSIRASALKMVNNEETKKRSFDLVAWFLCCSQAVWRELILPARRVWAGLAAVWLVIVAVNLAEFTHETRQMAKLKPETVELLAAWRQQQRLAQSVDVTPQTTGRHPSVPPRSRSDGLQLHRAA